MFNKNIKLVLAFLIIAYAGYQFVEGYIGNGIALIFLSLIFVFLYFRNEIILLAFLRMRKQDMEGTQKWLAKIKNPESSLIKKQQGYYNYLHGIIFSQKNLTQAEKYFKKALKLDSENASYWKAVAESDFRVGNIVSSIEAYENAAELVPADEDLWLDWSFIYYEQGEFDKALEIIESGYGHDGFLTETEKLTPILNDFIKLETKKQKLKEEVAA